MFSRLQLMARIREGIEACLNFEQRYNLGRRCVLQRGQLTILAKRSLGYKEYFTGREYLVKMGDWRNNKDDEVELDGIGGVNILVKADVHRSG